MDGADFTDGDRYVAPAAALSSSDGQSSNVGGDKE